MKNILFLTLILSFPSASNVVFNYNNSGGAGNNQPIFICALRPFQDIFMDIGMTEDIARYKVEKRCEMAQKGSSIFCKGKKATCSVSSLFSGPGIFNENGGFNGNGGFGSNGGFGMKSLIIYSDRNQEGLSMNINYDIPDLSRYNFDDAISSFKVPFGWSVRFYENKNYSGGFYTRESGNANATGFDNKVSSIKILKTF